MNNTNETKTQDVVLKNRESLHLTGVNKLVSLNKDEFILDTVLGVLVVKGSNLEMDSLDIDHGLIHIKGQIYLLEYQNKPAKTKEKSFLAKVFK